MTGLSTNASHFAWPRRRRVSLTTVRCRTSRRIPLGPAALAGLAAGALLAALPAVAAPSQTEQQLLGAINKTRLQHGLRTLRFSDMLSVASRAQSSYLASLGTLDHEGQDGQPFYVRLRAAGYPKTRALGETLGLVTGCSTDRASMIVSLWLGSPGHRAILLSPRYHVVGLGVIAGAGCGATIYTADFGG